MAEQDFTEQEILDDPVVRTVRDSILREISGRWAPEAARVKNETAELAEAQSRARDSVREFWDGFYRKHPGLKEHQSIVSGVFEANKAAWLKDEKLTINDVYSELEDKISHSVARASAKSKEIPVYTHRGKDYSTESGKEGGSLSSFIKKRQAAYGAVKY